MAWMVDHTQFQANHCRNPAAGPEFPSKAVSCRTPGQESGQASALLGGQPTWGTRWGAASQRPGAGFAAPLHPLADGALADAESFGNLTLGPALLLEVPGLEPSGVFPVGKGSVQTCESSLKWSHTLALNARVCNSSFLARPNYIEMRPYRPLGSRGTDFYARRQMIKKSVSD